MKKAICFDATQANAIRMCAEFNEAGIPAKFLISGIDKNKPDELALYERYKHLTGNREQLIKDFHDDKFTVICNSGILSTGYDETSIEVCILNRATQSVQFYIRQLAGLYGFTQIKRKHFSWTSVVTYHG